MNIRFSSFMPTLYQPKFGADSLGLITSNPKINVEKAQQMLNLALESGDPNITPEMIEALRQILLIAQKGDDATDVELVRAWQLSNKATNGE